MRGKLIIAVILLLLCHALYAQEVSYYVDFIDGKPKFFQILTWKMAEHVLQYEVLIQIRDNGYWEHLKEITKDTQLTVSLPPGNYRFCVTPYDLLKVRGEYSEWKEFEVLPALQPVISSFSPEVFYLDRILARELRLTGENLLTESEIYLKSNADELIPDQIIIHSDKSVTLVFDDMKLEPGDYDIHIKNPGGLSTQSGPFIIGYRKPLDIFLKLAYTPLIPIYRENTGNIDPTISFLGASFSFEVISSKRGDINGGLELATSVNYFNTRSIVVGEFEENEADAVTDVVGIIYTSFDLNIVMQKRFNRGRMAVSFRFGVGGAAVMSDDTSLAMKFNLGAEYMVRLYKVIYLEAGMDYNIDVSKRYPDFLKPRLGIVWQF